jgi:hypothetical protein
MADEYDIILAANYCSSMSDRAPDPKLKEQWLSLAAGCLSLSGGEPRADIRKAGSSSESK